MKNTIIGLIAALAIFIVGYALGSFSNGRYQPVVNTELPAITRFDTRTGLTEYYSNNHWVSIQTYKK
jgi:hypothetical protein